jgi:HisJ family histidinol phosphate phosphatase
VEYEHLNDTASNDPRLYAIPDIHGHAKGEHKAFIDERPIPLSARMLFLWFYHACRRGWPRFLMVTDHMNYLTFEDPAAINLVRRALKLAQAGDLYGAAETASVEVGHAAVVSEGLRRGMRYSIGAEVDNDPRSRPDAQNIVDAMKPDGMIRSVHFLTIDHPTHGPNWNWPFDNPEFADVYETVGTEKTWELYMTTLLDAVERLPGNILGHFYVPALFGHWPDEATLDAYENQIVDACEARGMAIEFNTRFLYRNHSDEEKTKYLAAHRRLLTKCKAKNVGIAVGSDAHSPKDQGRGFEVVLALLDECDVNELVFPIAGRLARVALRVERKVEAPPGPSAATEERRAARKARPSEPPFRDEVATAPASVDEEPPSTKAKARPKRSRAKSNEAAPEARLREDEDQQLPPAAAAELGIVIADSLVSDTVTEIVTDPDFEPMVVTIVPEPAEALESGLVPDDTAVGDTELDEPAPAGSPADEPAPSGSPAGNSASGNSASGNSASGNSVTSDSATSDSAAGDSTASGFEDSAPQDAASHDTVPDDSGYRVSMTDASRAHAPTTEALPNDVSTATALPGEDSTGERPLDEASTANGSGAEDAGSVDASLENPALEVAPARLATEADRVGAELEPAATLPQIARNGRPAPAAGAGARKPRPKGGFTKAKAPPDKTKLTAAKAEASATNIAKATAKATAKQVSAKTAAAKKMAAKQALAKKATAKKAAAKAGAVKKAAVKAGAAKKATAKKAAVRTSAAKKASAKKAAAKKASPKKPAQRRR